MSCCHVVSADGFAQLLQAIERGHEADAGRMPDERAALKVMLAAYERLKALGFRDVIYCPKDGQLREFIEVGSTGVHTGYRDTSGVWIAEAGDLWPSRAIMFREPPAPATEAQRAETHSGSVHEGAALAEGAPKPSTDPALLAVLTQASKHEMSPAEHDAQRRSWIIGEMGIEHPELSREELEALADHAVGAVSVSSSEPEMPHPGASTPRVGEG